MRQQCGALSLLLCISAGFMVPLSRAAGQVSPTPTHAPKQCAPGPVGRLTGYGEVFYRLLPDQRPDTASIIVLRVRGLSAAGFRSAVARSIPRCRFDLKASRDNRPALTQFVAFDSIGYKVAPAAIATDTAPEGMSLEPPPTLGDAFAAADPAVEEKPQPRECQPPKRGNQPRTMTFSSREEADRYFEQEARRRGGLASFTFVVLPDGSVDPSSFVVLTSTNPIANPEFLEMAMGCRYFPGRIRGVAVPVRVEQRAGMELRSGPR